MKTFPSHIFKMYDIRGIYPDELNEDLIYNIGRAYAEFMKKDLDKDRPKLVVCQDMRDSSMPLKEVLIRGMIEQGVDIVDIGLASTPTFYFGVGYYDYDGGIQVTASHNPAAYNGCKMVRPKAVPVSGNSGINDIRDMAQAANFTPAETPGTVETKDGVLDEQIAYALTQVDVEKIKPLHVVIDAANGMGAQLMDALFAKLPCKVDRMFFELDGSFPNHEADPLKDKNNAQLQVRVQELGADLGITLDGDGDRIFFVDNTGKTIMPAIMRGIFAQYFLRKHPGGTVAYDIRPGKITIDMIEEAGGKPVVTRVGHSLIKEKSREVGAIFAGESSGHFFLTMPHGIFEASEIMALVFLQVLSEAGQSAAELTAPLYRYAHSGEINFAVEDKDAVFTRLREKYGDNLQYDFDGLSFAWEDWWFNVRPSNTENKVRLNLESTDQKITGEKVKEVSKVIQGE